MWMVRSLAKASASLLIASAAWSFSGPVRGIMEGVPATNSAILVSTGTSALTSQVTVQNLSVQTLATVNSLAMDQLSANQCVQTTSSGGHTVLGTSGQQCGVGSGTNASTTTLTVIYNNGVVVSSPTTAMNFSSDFALTLAGTTTQVLLNPTVGQGQSFIMASPASQQPNTVWVGTVTTLSANIGSVSSTAGPRGNSDFAGAWMVIATSGTTQALTVISNGLPSNGVQNKIGAVTIRDDYVGDSGMHGALLVLVSSSTDAQSGRGMMEFWSTSLNNNDPKLWFHVVGHDSSPEIRDDAGAPNFEMVATSTDNAHGKGKFEPAAIAYQGVNLQHNSRAYDNSAFENFAYWTALQDPNPGLFLQAQTLANDSGILTSSDTYPIHWFTQNSHTVGLEGPLNTTASWRFRLPATFSNAGQVLYQAGNDSTSARPWAFTTGGSVGQLLQSNGTSAPTWTAGTPIYSQSTLQTGATFYVSSGTVNVLTSSNVFIVAGGSVTSNAVALGSPLILNNPTGGYLRFNGIPGSGGVPQYVQFDGQSMTLDSETAGLVTPFLGVCNTGSCGYVNFNPSTNVLCSDASSTCLANPINFSSTKAQISSNLTFDTTGRLNLGAVRQKNALLTVGGSAVIGSGYSDIGAMPANGLRVTGQVIMASATVSDLSASQLVGTDANSHLVTFSSLTIAGISSTAHLNVRSTAPGLSSCGSSPSIVGSDNGGTITLGTGSPTGCTVTFNATWSNTPFCVAQTTSSVTTAAVTSASGSQFVINTSATTPSNTINYVCIGRD